MRLVICPLVGLVITDADDAKCRGRNTDFFQTVDFVNYVAIIVTSRQHLYQQIHVVVK